MLTGRNADHLFWPNADRAEWWNADSKRDRNQPKYLQLLQYPSLLKHYLLIIYHPLPVAGCLQQCCE